MERRTLDPKVRYVWMVAALIPFAVWALAAAVVVVVGVPRWVTAIVAGVAVIALVAAIVLPTRWFRSWSYELRPLDLIVRHGVVVKSERWIPRTRIQYVDLIGGPLARALGLRTLVVFTAGSKTATVGLPGITVVDAEDLRAELLSWSRATAQPPLRGPGTDVPAEPDPHGPAVAQPATAGVEDTNDPGSG